MITTGVDQPSLGYARWAPPSELLGPRFEHQQGERSGDSDGGQVDHQLNGRTDCLARYPIGDRHGRVGCCWDLVTEIRMPTKAPDLAEVTAIMLATIMKQR